MTELTLVRHGATEWSANGRHTSVTDLDLTDAGVRQANLLHGKLDPSAYGLVLSSPRRRALRTAKLAGFTGPHEPEVTEDLAEWFYGDYEGLTSDQIRQTVPDWTIWTRPVPNGESAAQVTERLDRVVDRVRSSGVDKAIAFGHGHCLRALTCRWLALEVRMGGHFPLDTGTLSVLGKEKGFSTIDSWNAALE